MMALFSPRHQCIAVILLSLLFCASTDRLCNACENVGDCVRDNDLDRLKRLVNEGSSVLGDIQQTDIAVFLHNHSADSELFSFLLEQFMSMPTLQQLQSTLEVSAQTGHLSAVKKVLDISSQALDIGSALRSALGQSQCHIVQCLLEANGTYAVTMADDILSVVSKQCDEESLFNLVLPKANVLSTERSPLTRACQGGCVQFAKTLLEHGAPPRGVRNIDTPLFEAAKLGHLEIVELLVQYGANVNTYRVLERSIMERHQQIVKLLWTKRGGTDEDKKVVRDMINDDIWTRTQFFNFFKKVGSLPTGTILESRLATITGKNVLPTISDAAFASAQSKFSVGEQEVLRLFHDPSVVERKMIHDDDDKKKELEADIKEFWLKTVQTWISHH